ncbi:MAG: GTPase Era [Ruminococcaceae bacterium]|nr:GTPase Era [Oscillospiraceae bacterium]
MSKSGFIAIIGRPNVGKSTLLNALVGEKIAIVSNKPQTTRNRITGVLTREDKQYIFMDTPGLHTPKTKLGDYMVKTVSGTINDVDAVVLVADAGFPAGDIEKRIIKRLTADEIPAVLVLNKVDKCTPEQVGKAIEEYASLYDFHSVIPLSALKKDGVEIVLDETEAFLRDDTFFFPEDMLTDQPERQIAAEIIREKILRTTDDEIPHGTAVTIQTFEEGDKLIKIEADIICERESHKRILIGKRGETLKKIGTYAREDMEAFFDTKVYLGLFVKVKEKWRDSSFNLSDLGYIIRKD